MPMNSDILNERSVKLLDSQQYANAAFHRSSYLEPNFLIQTFERVHFSLLAAINNTKSLSSQL